ncbi:MAG: dihydroneopterin aldolase family protein [Methanomicrobiales archaeon]
MEEDVEKRFFENLSNRERTIFEGAITMGALFHQFIGTPVSLSNADELERSIENSMKLQPCIKKVEVEIDREILEESKSEFDYLSLSGDMLEVKVFSEYADSKAVIKMRYIEELKYPLMYVESLD